MKNKLEPELLSCFLFNCEFSFKSEKELLFLLEFSNNGTSLRRPADADTGKRQERNRLFHEPRFLLELVCSAAKPQLLKQSYLKTN